MPKAKRSRASRSASPAPILIGSDHAGFDLKELIRKALLRRGHDVCDFTPRRIAGDDYPIIGKEIARAVARTWSRVESRESRVRPRGILVCGSGVGVAIAANRLKGIRAVEGFDAKQVMLAREHNNANVLTLGEWNTPKNKAMALVDVFLKTPVSQEKRHQRRIKELG